MRAILSIIPYPNQGDKAKAASGDETIPGAHRGADEGAGLNMKWNN